MHWEGGVPSRIGMPQREMAADLVPQREPSFQEGLAYLVRSQVRRTAHTICGPARLEPSSAANPPEPVVRLFERREVTPDRLFGPADGFL